MENNQGIKENNNYSNTGWQIGGSIGSIAGVAYAFKVKSGFWKGWGYMILGGLLIGGLGYGIGMAIPKKEND